MSTRCKSVFDIPDVAAELADLHDKYVALPADKISYSIVCPCNQSIAKETKNCTGSAYH